MLFSRQRGKGDATSHYAARWLRLAAAGGGVNWPSSRRLTSVLEGALELLEADYLVARFAAHLLRH